MVDGTKSGCGSNFHVSVHAEGLIYMCDVIDCHNGTYYIVCQMKQNCATHKPHAYQLHIL